MSTEKSIDNSTSLFSFMAHLLLSLLCHKFGCLSNDASPMVKPSSLAKPTSFAEGKHHSKNAPLSVDKSAFFVALNELKGV